MQSKSSLDKAITNLANKYPHGFNDYYYSHYSKKPFGNQLSSQDLSELLAKFDGMNDVAARQKFADMALANPACRAAFSLQNNKLIKNWFDGLLRSKKSRNFLATKKHNEKLRLKKRQEKIKRDKERAKQTQLREAKQAEIKAIREEKQRQIEIKRAAKKLVEKKKLWKQLKLTDNQRDLLRQLSEFNE